MIHRRGVKESPIIFSGPMVLAILDGRKTCTRRLVTVPWKGRRRALPYEPYWLDADGRLVMADASGKEHPAEDVLTRWRPGMRLWVKETWAILKGNGIRTVYRADGEEPRTGWTPSERAAVRFRWRPSVFMPREHSRILLGVTAVRIERLQSITEDDALAEGVESAVDYVALWDEINGDRAPWKSNPWVWAITFKRG